MGQRACAPRPVVLPPTLLIPHVQVVPVPPYPVGLVAGDSRLL